MKFKESKEISLYKKIPLIFFLCCAVTVIMRSVQMFCFIDRETGFSDGGSFLSAVLYLIVAAASVFFALTAYMSKETAHVSLQVNKDTRFSVVVYILAVAFLYDSASALLGCLSSVDDVSYGVSAFQSMMLSGTIPQLCQSLFALFSAVYFLIFAGDLRKGTAKTSSHKFLAITPVGWAGFRLIYRFVEQISYVRVSELLLELVLLAAMIIFFMAFAQVASGVYVKNARWRIVGMGMPAALISLTVNIPRLIYALFSGTDALYSKYPFKVCDFITALFIVVLVMKLADINNETEKA